MCILRRGKTFLYKIHPAAFNVFNSIHNQKKKPPYGWFFGGADGNRTHVRRQLDKTFSERRLLFTFPQPVGNKHPTGISSFMMHGMGKAYHTHGLHWDYTRARLVDLPGRMGA